MLLHLNAGEHIPEHQARGAITVHCLAGKGTFVAGEEQMDLLPGVLLSVPGSKSHSVAAAQSEELLLLVTVSEQQ